MTTVLIADDSAVRRRIMSSVLERAGYDVVVAVDGLEAVRAVYRDRPDAVILDGEMPRLSGFVVTRLLKDDRETAATPVIIITSGRTASECYWGNHAGADRVLSHDFSPGDLLSVIHDLAGVATYGLLGGPPKAGSLYLDDDEVLARVAELLDRKLFEVSLSAEVTQIAVNVHGFEETVARALAVVSRVVCNDLAAIYLIDTRTTFVSVGRSTSSRQYYEFCASIADVATNLANQPVMVTDLVPQIADPSGYLGAEDEGGMTSFLWLPLRCAGELMGCVAVSSAAPDAFGEAGIDTLRVVEHAAAAVISSARLRDRPAVADVA